MVSFYRNPLAGNFFAFVWICVLVSCFERGLVPKLQTILAQCSV
jgi:hypothetical protein